jgi:hypothetical protein
VSVCDLNTLIIRRSRSDLGSWVTEEELAWTKFIFIRLRIGIIAGLF